MKKTTIILKFKKYVLVLFALFLYTSCETYLKDELLSDTSVDFLYSSPEGLESALVGLYKVNRSIFENRDQNGGIPLIIQSKSDLALGLTGEISLYSRLNWGATLGDHGSNSGYNYYWRDNYIIVERANAIIRGAETVSGMDDAQKNKILAEAKAMRANAYFTLYRLFNNIFITTEPTTPETAFDKPETKSSEEEIFNLLKSDLDFAIANLEWTTPEFGRWTQAAARHLRAKVAVWQKDWQEAASQADAVITNGSYSLLPNTKDVFKGNLNHSESLFVIQFERDAIGGGSHNFMNWNVVATYHSAPGLVRSVENGGSGAGFLLLNDYMRSLLNEDPNDDRDDRSYYISEYLYNDPTELPPGKQIGEPLDLYDQNSPDRSEFTNYYRRQNPGVLKFLDENAEPTDRSHIKNIMIYRLSETYLIGAEAHMELNNTDKALEYINAVRNRANAASISTVDQQAVLDERARELAFEGQRWFTLKRMGVLLSQMQQYAGNENWNATYSAGSPRVLFKEHMQNWPIPQSQIELLGPNYPQNVGY